jgi:hypothetical protein
MIVRQQPMDRSLGCGFVAQSNRSVSVRSGFGGLAARDFAGEKFPASRQ